MWDTVRAGHSRVVVARDSGAGPVAVQLTFDAKPEHPEEMARIQVRDCRNTYWLAFCICPAS